MQHAKINTGIPGLDEILYGGVLQGNSVLVTGAPGTGKTILTMQFIIAGARAGEPGLYITSEEEVDSIREMAREIYPGLDELERKGMLTFIRQSISSKKLMSIVTPFEIIKKNKIRRVVLDSLTLFGYIHVAGEMDYRKEVLDFIQRMKEAEVTLMATAEKSFTHLDELEYEPEDFLFDGLILLSKMRRSSSFERILTIAKMRNQGHMLDIYPFIIDGKGIKVFHDQLPFSLFEKDFRKEE